MLYRYRRGARRHRCTRPRFVSLWIGGEAKRGIGIPDGNLIDQIPSIDPSIFRSIPSVPFHSIPFHSIPFHSIPFVQSIPFHSIPFHSNSHRHHLWSGARQNCRHRWLFVCWQCSANGAACLRACNGNIDRCCRNAWWDRLYDVDFFITNLAFEGQAELINASKMAILLASLCAGILGFYCWLSVATSNKTDSQLLEAIMNTAPTPVLRTKVSLSAASASVLQC